MNSYIFVGLNPLFVRGLFIVAAGFISVLFSSVSLSPFKCSVFGFPLRTINFFSFLANLMFVFNIPWFHKVYQCMFLYHTSSSQLGGNSPLVPSSQEVTVDAAQGHCHLQMSSAWLQCLAAFLDCSFYFVLLASISHKNFSSLFI